MKNRINILIAKLQNQIGKRVWKVVFLGYFPPPRDTPRGYEKKSKARTPSDGPPAPDTVFIFSPEKVTLDKMSVLKKKQAR